MSVKYLVTAKRTCVPQSFLTQALSPFRVESPFSALMVLPTLGFTAALSLSPSLSLYMHTHMHILYIHTQTQTYTLSMSSRESELPHASPYLQADMWPSAC